jgi:ATP-dependent exoDNAse (exonuclease V) beta subunit
MSIHKSKGLQFPVVFFCAGFSGGKAVSEFRYIDDEKRQILDFRKTDEVRGLAARYTREEKKRSYYVALTRAVNRVYLPLIGTEWEKSFIPLHTFYADLCGGAWDSFLEDGNGWGGAFKSPPDLIHYEKIMAWTSKAGKMKTDYRRRAMFFFHDFFSTLSEDNPEIFVVESAKPAVTGVLKGHSRSTQGPLTEPLLKGAPFYRRIVPVTSFSALSSGIHTETDSLIENPEQNTKDRDYRDSAPEKAVIPEEGILPAGPLFGEMVHSLLENADYSAVAAAGGFDEYLRREEIRDFYRTQIRRYYPADKAAVYAAPSARLVWNTLRTPLPPAGNLRLCGLSPESRRHEVEFFLRLKDRAVFPVADESVKQEGGFLKGYIDLVFHSGGRFYILDWKSNLSPADPADYSPAVLKKMMDEHRYDLQYRLYLAALASHYRVLPGGENVWDRFGGVFYLFVRGLGEGEQGIHFARPEPAVMEEFMSNFTDLG